MQSDGYGFCESCRDITTLYRLGDFMVCKPCLPIPTKVREVSEHQLTLRKKRADISRTRKLLDRNKLQLIREVKHG